VTDRVRKDFTMKIKVSGFPLPEPIELAKLAATLSGGLGANTDREVKAALRRALQFYLGAVFFHRQLSGTSLNDLIAQFGTNEQLKALFVERVGKSTRPKPTTTLEHDPKKKWSTDQAGQYLDEHGLRFKMPKSLLNRIRRLWPRIRMAWLATPTPSINDFFLGVEEFIEKTKRIRNGRDVYDLPKPILDEIIEVRRESQRRSAQTRKAVKRGAQNPSNQKF
jgi:hypothetical protein